MQLTPAVAWAAAWAVVQVGTSRLLFRTFGDHDIEGSPRWRCASSLPTQFLFLPALLHSGGDDAGMCFNYIFALYMIIDFFMVPMSAMVKLHHFVCLGGQYLVNVMLPVGFTTFFAGCVALEFGSGCMNFALLNPDATWRKVLAVLGMTLSNILSAILARTWMLLPVEPALSMGFFTLCLNLFATVALIVMRQQAIIELAQRGFRANGVNKSS